MRADTLFLLINEIDDKLIIDADNADDQHVEVTYRERKFALREFAALAACIAVLAIGIFTVVKFRIGDIVPHPDDSQESSVYSEQSASEDSISDSSSENNGVPEKTIDEDYPDILQIKLPAGSFEEKLRYIMLRARTVEELENNIRENDTDGRVLEIKVTPEFYYKNEDIMTEGSIENGMTIRITYDEKNTGLLYIVGSMLDVYYGQLISEGDFPNSVTDIIQGSASYKEAMTAIKEFDTYDRLDRIRFYKDGHEILQEDFALECGMIIHIDYDGGRSHLDFVKS